MEDFNKHIRNHKETREESVITTDFGYGGNIFLLK